MGGSIFRMAQSHGIGWPIDSLPQGLSVAPRVSTCHGRWLPVEQDEGGIGEEKERQRGSCRIFMNSCTPSLPHCPVGHPDQPCNVTETTERQRSDHREGRTTEAHLGASCPATVEGLLPSYCPPPLPCKTQRYIRQRWSLVFFLKGQISHKA